MPITINTYCRVNQNGSININTDPTFPQPLPSPDPNYACVSGAGTPEINGTYTFLDNYTFGVEGTRPRYQNALGLEILAAVGFAGDSYRWFFYYFDGDASTYWYRGNTIPAPAYPWLETSWSIYGDGVAPVPTVIIGQC